MRRAVFLDRDGVVTRSEVRDGRPYAPRRLEDMEILADVPQALAALAAADYALVIVTNQPDVGNGLVDRSVVEAMHERLIAVLPIDALKVCYHRQNQGCSCRKPKPGMLIEAGMELGLDLARSTMIGDRWSDVAAGRAAGCRTVFIDRHYAETRPEPPDAIVASLGEAVRSILAAMAQP